MASSALMELLLLPFSVLIAVPGLAFVPALALAVLAARRWRRLRRLGRAAVPLCVSLWVAYAIYETAMYFWMRTVIAPIRVDLLLLAPPLWLAAIIVVLVAMRTPAPR